MVDEDISLKKEKELLVPPTTPDKVKHWIVLWWRPDLESRWLSLGWGPLNSKAKEMGQPRSNGMGKLKHKNDSFLFTCIGVYYSFPINPCTPPLDSLLICSLEKIWKGTHKRLGCGLSLLLSLFLSFLSHMLSLTVWWTTLCIDIMFPTSPTYYISSCVRHSTLLICAIDWP